MKKYELFLNITATLIIGIAVIGILILSFTYLCNSKDEIQTIKIEYTPNSSDSSLQTNYSPNTRKLDSTLAELRNVSQKIQNRQLKLIESKENDNFFNKLYTAIVAIILSIAGFFGFKSMNEIKEKAIEEAKINAVKASAGEFKKTFSADYEKKILDSANQAMNDFLRTEIELLQDRIAELERQIPNMEPENQDPQDLNQREEDNQDPFEND